MRVLILGATGMLGHKLWQRLREKCDCRATVRAARSACARVPLLDDQRILCGADLCRPGCLEELFQAVKPAVVLNCVGLVKRLRQSQDPAANIEVNALLPHRVHQLCSIHGARLIHFSTDCVFSGRRGGCREQDPCDADDLYGVTKALGEVVTDGALTIRSSFIGRELTGAVGLLEWFLAQQGGRVRGFRRAIFSGFTTLQMAEIVWRVISEWPHLAGLYHVASEPISKHALLGMVRDAFELDIEVVPDDEFACDRSLDGSAFAACTGFQPPSWRQMIEALRDDPSDYDQWRVPSWNWKTSVCS